MEKPNKEFYPLLYSLLLVANKVADKSWVGQRINFQVGVMDLRIERWKSQAKLGCEVDSGCLEESL